MIHASEAFAGGWFGFGRTYGFAVRFEIEDVGDLEKEWTEALAEIKQWRIERGARALSVDLFFVVPDSLFVNQVVRFIGEKLLSNIERVPSDLSGLRVDVAIFGLPDMEQYLDLTIYGASFVAE